MIKLETLFERKYGAIRGGQTKLSKDLGVDQSTISSWIRGRNKPTKDYVKKMAIIFGVSEDYINNIFAPVYVEETQKPTQFIKEVEAVPLTPKNTIQLPILADVPAGLRRGEIAKLKWQDVDFKNNQLYIAPDKTEKHRYIPIADDLRKALEKAKKERKKNVYVINVGDTDNRADKDYLGAYYRKATHDLPFNCFLHKLRHTFASHLVQAGIDLYRVKNLMGHSSITMTEIYAHLAPADLKSAIKALPKIKK